MRFVPTALILLAACAKSDPYPAFHPAVPQVITKGGPVLASPRIVPVFFANGDSASDAARSDFLKRVGASDYWHATTSEYGVGPATSTAPVTLSESPTGSITNDSIAPWLVSELEASGSALPAPDENTVYAINYPPALTYTFSDGAMCTPFHDFATLDAQHGGTRFAYLVVGGCGDSSDYTGGESHELIEAATDPYVSAYSGLDDAHSYWGFYTGSEVADMCMTDPEAFTTFSELAPHVVERTWSNKSAAAGSDPCVPETPGEIYFNSAPIMSDTFNYGLPAVPVIGVHVPVGQSKTIDVDLFSDANTNGTWQVTATNFQEFMMPAGTNLKLTLDHDTGQNGDVLHLTIETLAANPLGADLFVITSTLGKTKNIWMGVVGESATGG